MTLASTLFLSLFITLAFIPLFKGIAVRAHIMDMPDERKVHSSPIPKIGGLGMALGFCIPILLWLPLDRFVVALLIGIAILVAAGLVDDMYVLGYKPKFLAQIAAALVVILYGGVNIGTLGVFLPDGFVLPQAIALPLTLLVIVGITNAINLADGLDGLAGGLTLISFLCLSALAYRLGDSTTLIMSLAMLGVLFGFLSFNTYPASVFMGDAGSQFLGFISIVLSLRITQGYPTLSPFLPFLIIGLPIIDTLIVMSERMINHRSPFVADNNHFHHKLLGLGLFHTEAVFIIYLIQSIFVASAYFFRFYSDFFILTLYIILSGMISSFIFATYKYDIKLKRYEFIDKVIKGKLKFLKNKSGMLHAASISLNYLLPVLLIINCIMINDPPQYTSLLAFSPALVILFLWLIKYKMLGSVVRLVLYLMISTVLYFNQEQTYKIAEFNLGLIYWGCCALCFISGLIMVRFDRRGNRFRSSPMDFLVLIIALSISPLLNFFMDPQKTRIFLVQILIFYYSYEILLNGRKKEKNVAVISTLGSLLVLSLKGLLFWI